MIYEFCSEYYANHRVDDARYHAIVNRFGEIGAVELVGIMGYYGLVAMTLNVFEMALPEANPSPLTRRRSGRQPRLKGSPWRKPDCFGEADAFAGRRV